MQQIDAFGNQPSQLAVDLLFTRLRASFFQLVHSWTSRRFRKGLEYIALCGAIYALVLLFQLHVRFVTTNACADDPLSIFGDLPQSPYDPSSPSIISLKIQRIDPIFPGARLNFHESGPMLASPIPSLRLFSDSSPTQQSVLGISLSSLLFGDLEQDQYSTSSSGEEEGENGQNNEKGEKGEEEEEKIGQPAANKRGVVAADTLSIFEEYEFALERGFLLVGPEARRLHNITRVNLTIAEHHPCLGGPDVEWLLDNLLGYDTLVLNALIHRYSGRGYVHALHTGDIYDLWYIHEIKQISSDLLEWSLFQVSILLTAIFIWFTSTMLVSITFRETQLRLLFFTASTQHHVRHGLSVRHLLLAHLSQSFLFVLVTIGVLLCISEFLDDRLLGLLMLSIVWLTEPFSLIVLHTASSRYYFPRVFFAYLLAYLVYFFSFPFGYGYFGLFVLSLFVLHLMIRYLNENVIAAYQPLPIDPFPQPPHNNNNQQQQQPPEQNLEQLPEQLPEHPPDQQQNQHQEEFDEAEYDEEEYDEEYEEYEEYEDFDQTNFPDQQ